MPNTGVKSPPPSRGIGSATSGPTKRRIAASGGSSTYWPTNANYVEVWRFDMASGNLVSENEAITFAIQSNSPTYESTGPAGTDLVSVTHVNTGSWFYGAGVTAYSPRTNDFSVSFVMKVGSSFDFVVMDLDRFGHTSAGFYLGRIGTELRIQVGDGTLSHTSSWTDANGASAVYDGNWHHIQFIANRSNATVTVKLDGVAQTVTKSSGSDLSALGDINVALTNGICIGSPALLNGRYFSNSLQIAYVAFAHDATTTPPLLP